ncbi:hypothetical protein D3C73_1364360 [compost metagenome]
MCTFSWSTSAFDESLHAFQFVAKIDGLVSSMAEIGTSVVVPGSARRAASAWIIWSCAAGPMCAPSWRLADVGQPSPPSVVDQ